MTDDETIVPGEEENEEEIGGDTELIGPVVDAEIEAVEEEEIEDTHVAPVSVASFDDTSEEDEDPHAFQSHVVHSAEKDPYSAKSKNLSDDYDGAAYFDDGEEEEDEEFEPSDEGLMAY